ncbi:hypothetical protein ILYODFUR_037266 [Ilyodon furcidens]|uniref:Uncharacterized protein n=1 Tax=Ilyodon furcidens TaxID=33524 RepID=A0ABV0UEL5_9TELE
MFSSSGFTPLLTSFHRLVSKILFFRSKFMPIGEGRNVDQAVNRELRLLAQVSLHNKRRVRGLPLQQATQILRPQLRVAASTIKVENMVHSVQLCWACRPKQQSETSP